MADIEQILKEGDNIIWKPENMASREKSDTYSVIDSSNKRVQADLSGIVKSYKGIQKSISEQLNKKISVMDYLSGKIKGETNIDTVRAIMRKVGFSRFVASKGLSGAMEELVQLISDNCKTLETYTNSLAETANTANAEITELRAQAKEHAIRYETATKYVAKLEGLKSDLEKELSAMDAKSVAGLEVKQKLDLIRPKLMESKSTVYSSQRARDRVDNLAEGLTYTSEMVIVINENLNELYTMLSSILDEQETAIRAQTELTKAGDLTLETVSNYGLYHEKINEIAVANSRLVAVFSRHGADMIEQNTYDAKTLQEMRENLQIARENQARRIEEGRKAYKAPENPPSQ